MFELLVLLIGLWDPNELLRPFIDDPKGPGASLTLSINHEEIMHVVISRAAPEAQSPKPEARSPKPEARSPKPNGP